jgi:two-component system sensor histidine kinase KdpD
MARGKLRIYLGAAPGVGKTFAMLNEGWRAHTRGTDVVVGFVETHGRPHTAEQVRDLEVVPRKVIEYRGQRFEEMDVDAILARRPERALIDELAHTNIPGSRHEKRWQDIDELLDAGIDVISTVNIQHLESLNDVVQRITGVVQRETVPDAWVRAADQIELVDMSPEALRRRLAHGNVYAPDKVDAALANYFRVGNLAALRELALMWLADQVEESIHQYMVDHGISAAWETRERVVVALTGAPGGETLIRRAARMAQRTKGDLLGVHVRSSTGLAGPPTELLERHRKLLEELGGTYHEIVAADPPKGLVDFARAEHATQLVLGSSQRSRWHELTRGSVINAVIRQAGDIDIHVISTRTDGAAGETERRRLPRGAPRVSVGVSRRRQLLAWALAAVGLPVVTAVLAGLRHHVGLPSDLLIYLLMVLVVATVGGTWPGLGAAVAADLLANWFFIPPIHTFTISASQNVLALLVFLAAAGMASWLVGYGARRAGEAARARSEAAALARLAGALLREDDPLSELVDQLRATFGLQAVSVLHRGGDGSWHADAATGEPAPSRPEDATDTVALDHDSVLAITGPELSADDLRVLHAFTDQMAVALRSRKLRAEAAAAEALAQANNLRTALLRAVSHDLRTPLASIKASATTLLAEDLNLPPESTQQLLKTINEEADRLNALIDNLLDMSRLQAGTFEPMLQDVGLEEVVARALASLPDGGRRVVVEVPEDLRIRTDAALLERAIANVIDNALAWTAEDEPVRVEAAAVAGRIDVRVIDRGPGIPRDQRENIFRPFQRLGDKGGGAGVGLGLAVARGFVEALGGELAVEDTPGGGTTMVFSFRCAG